MTPFILNSKLTMPAMGKVFSRQSLLQRLHSNLDNPLSVICAPSGYGKTTLVSDFLQQQSHPYCWLSLDEKNNVGSGFWSYLCAAIKTVDAKAVETAELYLQNSYIEDYRLICDALLESLEKRSRVWDRPSKLILVLDDFQFIDHPQVLASFNRFLDYLPNWLHVVITSRAMPQLSIPKRVSKLLAHVILRDELIIPPEQVADFLFEKLAINVTAQQALHIHTSTEGWAAAIQLMGLSIKHGSHSQATAAVSPDGLLNGFLFEDVFQQLSHQQQQALLVVSPLQQFNGAILDAMLVIQTGQNIIDELLAEGLFVSPVDDKHTAYRLHSLFKQWLIEKFHQQADSQAAIQRGFDWLMRHGFFEQALLLAVDQQDWPNAAAMMMCLYPSSAYSRHQDQALRLLALFPLNIVQSMPHLAMMQAVIASQHYQHQSMQLHCDYLEIALKKIQRQLSEQPKNCAQVLADFGLQTQAQLDLLLCGLMVLQGQLARMSGQRSKARELDEKLLHTSAIHNTSLQCWAAYGGCADAFMDDDMLAAIKHGQQAIAGALLVNDVNCEIATLAWLLPALLLNGQIKPAEKMALSALQKLAQHGMENLPNQSGIYLALVQNYMEQNRIEEAWQIFYRLQHYLKNFPDVRELTYSVAHCHVQLLALSGLQTQTDNALDELLEFEKIEFSGQVFVGEFHYVTLLDVHALNALIQLKNRNAMVLIQWAQTEPTDEHHLCAMRLHYEQFIYAIGQSMMGQDMADYLTALNQLSQQNGVVHRAIGIAMLAVRFHLANENMAQALAHFREVLILAAPYQFVNLIIDGTENMAALLNAAMADNIESRYCQFLLKQLAATQARHFTQPPGSSLQVDADSRAYNSIALNESAQNESSGKAAANASGLTARQAQSSPTTIVTSATARPLAEPLTPRERQILQLLSEGGSNQQMADSLGLSVSTVKRHLQNIYGKLHVKNRTAAIRHMAIAQTNPSR